MELNKLLDKKIWFYEMFFIIFFIISILNTLGIYEINDKIINSFTLGTFLFTISDLVKQDRFKNIFLLFGMFAVIALPNCNYILDLINNFIGQDVLMLLSLALVFLSLTINEKKEIQIQENYRIIEEKNKTLQFQNELLGEQQELLKDQENLLKSRIKNIEKKNEINLNAFYEMWNETKKLNSINIAVFENILNTEELSDEAKENINNIIINNKNIIKNTDKKLIEIEEILKSN